MALDFLGTLNLAQLNRFAAFARAQTPDISGRISHLTAELVRIGVVTFLRDAGGTPTAYEVDSPDSYLGKLVAVYEVLGGDPFYDLNLRVTTQPLYYVKADEATPPQLISNGEVIATQGLSDGDSAELMHQGREWLSDVLSARREYIERKIRRALDYVDQLQAEIDLLNVVSSEASVAGSLEFVLSGINELINDKNYRAATTNTDPLNRMGYAGFAPYEPGVNRSAADTYVRTMDGPMAPGETKP